jgi:putative spermidine/putrescine transport system substrate-binding protein
MKGTPNKANAERVIEFMGRAEHQARLPRFVRYGVTNREAAARVDPALMAELPTNPANLSVAFQEDVRFWIDNIDRLAERWNKWAATK